MTHGIWMGLQQVSYDNDQYRATIKGGDQHRENVFISVNVLSMKEAIRETTELAKYWKSANA